MAFLQFYYRPIRFEEWMNPYVDINASFLLSPQPVRWGSGVGFDWAADVAPLKFEQLGVQHTIAQLVFQGFQCEGLLPAFLDAQAYRKQNPLLKQRFVTFRIASILLLLQ